MDHSQYEKLTRELNEYKRLYRDAMERADCTHREANRMAMALLFIVFALVEVKDCISERKHDEACRSNTSR